MPLSTILLPVLKIRLPLLVFLVSILLSSGHCLAGNDGFSFGPRALGTGQSGLMHTDIWAIHNNVGALGWLKKAGAGVSFENRYALSALNQISFAVAIPNERWGVAAIGASRFGSEIYNQTRAQLGWAKAFGIASVGLEAQMYQVGAQDFASRQFFILNFGGLAQLTPKLHFAGSVSNITQTKASDYQNEKIPTIVRAGLSFIPNKKVKLMSEVQKDLDQKALVKIGLEYEFIEHFWLRTGFTSQTMQVCGGVGAQWRNLVFDFAFARHPQLGWTNAIGINFLFGKTLAETTKAK